MKNWSHNFKKDPSALSPLQLSARIEVNARRTWGYAPP